ncbi:hypothetical protein N7457_001843 [Penicillium paradoxum]|uniref:uncharacterized protein n=1 Tax=Penicillium paradoxum TaxID=176176 RepID=UPI002548825A|nr:uncharacterized protein N7457_001843 [Penicillium paradoxum]KAJ5795244.1 hypothetical protein N7457_001843 [Penicillium paradoxum]
MSEPKKLRKRCKAKRWLRSWVFTPFGNVKIKLIHKIERRRSQNIPDSDLKRIVLDALSDRYPTRHFRGRNESISTPGRMSPFSDEYSLSVVDLESSISSRRNEGQQEHSCRWRRCNDQPERVTLAVATLQPHHRIDPRNTWRGDFDGPTVLQVMNPDFSSDSSSEDHNSPKAQIIHTYETEHILCEPPAIVVTSPEFRSEILSEDGQLKQLRTDENVSHPFIATVTPCVPGLYFIDRPDPPLSCLITQALRDSNSPIVAQKGICSCSPSAHLSHSIDFDMFSVDMSPSSIIHSRLPKSATENIMNRAYRKQDTFLMHRAKVSDADLRPRPLNIRKGALQEKIRNGTLQPLPINTSHGAIAHAKPPYNLYHKIHHGSPSLPPSTSDQPRITSTCVSSYEPTTPSDLQLGGYRPSSLCNNWVEAQARYHAFYTHPSQFSGLRGPQGGSRPPGYPVAGSPSYGVFLEGLFTPPEPDRPASNEPLPGLAMSLSAGTVARCRRRLDGQSD